MAEKGDRKIQGGGCPKENCVFPFDNLRKCVFFFFSRHSYVWRKCLLPPTRWLLQFHSQRYKSTAATSGSPTPPPLLLFCSSKCRWITYKYIFAVKFTDVLPPTFLILTPLVCLPNFQSKLCKGLVHVASVQVYSFLSSQVCKGFEEYIIMNTACIFCRWRKLTSVVKFKVVSQSSRHIHF